MILLSAAGVSRTVGGRRLFSRLTLVVNSGDVVLLSGPNGSGKSTFLRAVSGDAPLDAGTIEIAGRRLGELPRWEQEIVCPRVDQDPVLDLDVPVADNLIDTLSVGRGLLPWLGPFRERMRRGLRRELNHAIAAFGLEGAWLRPAGELSYGQRRLVSVLRAIRLRPDGGPRLVLLDEPLSGLHEDKVDAVLSVLQERLSRGWALMTAEHHPQIQRLPPTRVVPFPATHE